MHRRELLLGPGSGLTLVERSAGAPTQTVRFGQLRLRRSAGRHRVEAHLHATYEALIPLRGTYRCTIDGHGFSAKPGEVLAVRPGEVHADDTPGPLLLAALQFAVEPPIAWPDGPRVLAWAGATALVKSLRDEPDDAHAAAVQDARCRELLARLLRAHGPADAPPFATELRRLLDARLDRPLDLDGLAEELRISRRTLTDRCRGTCGTSPARLLQELRLERARTLLTETVLPVKAIATRCGFANPNHFATAYRTRFGHPPRATPVPRHEGPTPAR